MKVILLKDIPNVGRKYDVKTFADGYARNFIIKNKLGEMATPKLLSSVLREKARIADERKIHEDLLIKNLEELEGVTLTLPGKANEHGHLFAGIHKEELVSAIREKTRFEINPDYIELNKPIKEVGEHKVVVKIQNKEISFKVVVEKE